MASVGAESEEDAEDSIGAYVVVGVTRVARQVVGHQHVQGQDQA